MSKVVQKYNGKVVSKAELDELMPRKKLEGPAMTANTYSEHDPLISEGCGVMKSQVKETRAILEAHKIPGVAVLNSGQMRFTSRRARKEWLKVRGLHDQDGGYSDG
jgi:exopolysaccharide biosynthesis protein